MAKLKILVVEDESIVAKDIQNSLKKLGYIVPTIVASGEKAIEEVEQSRPDLVLMDIMLKGEMNGIDVANIIRDKFEIPVIFLTAYADDNTLAKLNSPNLMVISLNLLKKRNFRLLLKWVFISMKKILKLKEKGIYIIQ